METITISKEEYRDLKKIAEVNETLLMKLVVGLEDIRAGRVKPWTRKTKRQVSS